MTLSTSNLAIFLGIISPASPPLILAVLFLASFVPFAAFSRSAPSSTEDFSTRTGSFLAKGSQAGHFAMETPINLKTHGFQVSSRRSQWYEWSMTRRARNPIIFGWNGSLAIATQAMDINNGFGFIEIAKAHETGDEGFPIQT